MYEDAIADCNEVIRLNPGVTDGYTLRSECYEKQKLYAKAIADLREAIRLTREKYMKEYFEKALKKLISTY